MADNTQAGVLEELDKYIRDRYYLGLSETPPEYTGLFKQLPWDQKDGLFEPFIRRYQARSIDPAPHKPEGATITGQLIQGGRTKDVYSARYATALTFTYEKWKTGVKALNSYFQTSELLADSMRMTLEAYFIAILAEADNGGAPAELLCFDGQELCDAAHTLLNGGADSNLYGVVSAVSYATLDAITTMIDTTLSEDGYPHPKYKATQIIVPPEEELNALETLKSIGRPDTANRAESVLKMRESAGFGDGSVKVSRYMPNDRWFVQDAKNAEYGVYMLEAPDITGPFVDEKTDDASWYVKAWISRASWDWRGIVMASRT